MKPKTGRPKLPAGQSKSVQIGVRFSRVEMQQIEEAARARKQPVVEFIRHACSQGVLAWVSFDLKRDIKIKRRDFKKWGNAK